LTTLYLARHGETQWNKENRCQGCTDIELNECGLLQTKAIAQRLSAEKIDVIYSSMLQRAYLTAEAIACRHNMKVIKNSALNEINFGTWEGMTFEEMKNDPEYDLDGWRNTPHIARFPGEGNLRAVQERAMAFINEVLVEDKGKNILVVSHGGILKTIILGLLGISLEAYNKFFITNVSLSTIIVDDDRTYIKLLNDTCHLEQDYMVKPIF